MPADYKLSWTSTRSPMCTHVLVTFDLIRFVGSAVMTLDAPPRVPSQQRCLAVGIIAVNRLSQTAVFTRHDEIPNVRFAD